MTALSKTAGVPFVSRILRYVGQDYLAIPYSPEELTKVFLAQCYDIGITATSQYFGCSPAVLNRIKTLYARFLSAPCNKEAFTFFQMCYDDGSVIDILLEAFDRKIQTWKENHAMSGGGYRFSAEECSKLTESNRVVKKVVSGTMVETTNVIGELTGSLLMLECDELQKELKILLSALMKQQAATYTDALLSLHALNANIKVCQPRFDAVLLLYMNKGYGCSYSSIIQEVCRNYEI